VSVTLNNLRIFFLCLFLLGAGIRALDVWRPIDGSINPPWREADIASIARNYYREDMNLFSPRIDWRGDGPGYVEMEFPIYLLPIEKSSSPGLCVLHQPRGPGASQK